MLSEQCKFFNQYTLLAYNVNVSKVCSSYPSFDYSFLFLDELLKYGSSLLSELLEGSEQLLDAWAGEGDLVDAICEAIEQTRYVCMYVGMYVCMYVGCFLFWCLCLCSALLLQRQCPHSS